MGEPRRVKWRLEYKLQDIWVGVYWEATDERIDVWVCVAPCFPVHVWWRRSP